MSAPLRFSSFKYLVLSIAFTLLGIASTFAQGSDATALKSRIAVVASETKTSVWVSDFPKSTSVVLFDEENNILSIVSTNEYGAAYIALPKAITSTVFAKTLNSEVSASNKAVLKAGKQEQNVAAKEQVSEATKA